MSVRKSHAFGASRSSESQILSETMQTIRELLTFSDCNLVIELLPYKSNECKVDVMSNPPIDDTATIADQIYQCFEQGDLTGAIAHLDEAIRNYPEYAYFYTERADFRARLGDCQGAIEDYTSAILLSPRTALFYTWRGRMYRKMGEEAAAIADFLKASTLQSGS